MSRTLKNTLWFIGGLSFMAIAFAQESKLTIQLIESRLADLSTRGMAVTDETVKTYESALSWMREAASHERDAVMYVNALTAEPRREAEIQSRMDRFEIVDSTVVDFSGLSLQELGGKIRQVQAERLEAENARDRIDQRLANRETNANLSRSRLDDIVARLSELQGLDVMIDRQALPSLDEALQWVMVAEQNALSAERRAQQARLASQSVRYSALRTERAELAMKIADITRKEHNLELLSRNKLPDVLDSQEIGIEVDNPVYAITQQFTLINAELREKRLLLETQLDDISLNKQEVKDLTLAFADRFATARRVVDFASDSDILGELLLAHWQELEGIQISISIENLSQQAGNTVINRIAHEKALAELASTFSYISGKIEAASLTAKAIPEQDWDILIELAQTQRELLRRLITAESNYIDVLDGLNADYTRFTELIHDYKAYLSTLILWVPSRPMLWKSDVADIPVEFGHLKNGLRELRPSIKPSLLITLLIAVVLFLVRSRLKHWQYQQHSLPLRFREPSLRFTLLALLSTVLRALPLPLLLMAIGMLFSHQIVQFAAVLTSAIVGLAVVLFALILMCILCEESGVAKKHFGWKLHTCRLINEWMSWLMLWWLPVTAIASFLFMLDDDTVLLGRLSLLFSLSLLIAHIIFQSRQELRASGKRRVSINRNFVRVLLIALLVVLMGGIIWGLRYSVSIMATSLVLSLWVSVGLVLVYNIIMCWLRVMETRMQLVVQTEPADPDACAEEVEQAVMADISADTTRLFNALAMAAALLALYYIWTPLFPALDALARVSLWQSKTMIDGELVISQITLETLVVIGFLATVTIYAARKLPALVELILHSRTRVSFGSRFAVATLLSYVIVGAGAFAALSSLGLRWSQLQWLVAALGIGIGFGLQEIIANFISGLIILFERPVRVGDFVSVGTMDGVVKKIHIRATIIEDRDGRELVVPNKEFVTGQLLNWTLSEKHVRIAIPVGVAYGSDVHAALKILQEVATENPNVPAHPKPRVIFERFGDNTLELTLRCYIGDVDELWEITSDLNCQINQRFSEAGIVIAFPQRDIHFNPDQPLKIEIGQSPQT